MIKLKKPVYKIQDSLTKCSSTMRNTNHLKSKVTKSERCLVSWSIKYKNKAESANLYQIRALKPLIPRGKDKPAISLGKEISDDDLVKLYEEYFVPESKEARVIYDSLMDNANDKCPFCGGIGEPANLDHYLPKTYFPQFSLLPFNLIPACRDCNMGSKGSSYAKADGEQVIQPYFDNDIFFDEQWVHASFIENKKCFQFFVKYPESWSEVDKLRVKKHFEDFSIAKRYASQTVDEATTLFNQIKAQREHGLSNLIIISTLIEPVIASGLFANHWKRVMYLAVEEFLKNRHYENEEV